MGQRFFFFFGIFVVLLIITMGVVILIEGETFLPHMTAGMRIAFGCLLIIYGLFRSLRYWKAKRADEDEEILDR